MTTIIWTPDGPEEGEWLSGARLDVDRLPDGGVLISTRNARDVDEGRWTVSFSLDRDDANELIDRLVRALEEGT